MVIIDQDQVETGGRCLRVHVHGEAPAVSAPEPFVPQRRTGSAKAAAAAAVMGAVLALGGCTNDQRPPGNDPIDVRDQPPKVAPPTPEAENTSPIKEETNNSKTNPPPIEVRDYPPIE